MEPALLVFLLVYAGMLLGGIPGLALDRSGVALLGAIAVLATGAITPRDAWSAIDVPTIGLLFAMMVVSAQLRLGGFYSAITGRLAAREDRPSVLLLQVVLVSGGLSALLANDVVCLAMTPMLVDLTVRRALDPVPFLLGLAAGANVGSAATLIGNPQNMLIGETLDLSFGAYLLDAAPPAILGLAATWWILARAWRGRFRRDMPSVTIEPRRFDRWQSTKGVAVVALLVIAFLAIDVPREVLALTAAGLLLLSRRMHSREVVGLVDWQVILLFLGLFVVHGALARTGAIERAIDAARASGIDVAAPPWLFGLTVVLSNLVSNVPAVMLLLPATSGPQDGALLALASTLAGNFVLVGSIANLIVVEQATRLGVAPRDRSWFAEHWRAGAPVTLVTLGIASGWLALTR